jgi:hypothetical protein
MDRRGIAMRTVIVVLAVAALAGCGVDTMGSAATAAALKKQELEQGKQSMQQAQQKIDQAMKSVNERSQKSLDDGIK